MSDAASPFAPLVATIRDLTLQPHSASDATAAAAADFQFAFEKHHPPSLPFDTRATILAQLHACNARVADWFDDAINQQLNSHDKQLLLQCVTNHAHATCNPLCEQSCSVFQNVPAWLTLLKVLVRTRSQLESTLYAQDFILFLIDNIDKHTTAGKGNDAAAAAASAEHEAILSQSLRLLLNLCVVNRNLVHTALGCGKRAESSAASPTVDALDPSHPEPLAALVGALGRMRNSAAEPDALWLHTRVLLFVLVRPELAERAIVRADLFATLLRVLLWATDAARLDLPLRDRDSSAAAALHLVDHGRADPPDQPKLALELLRVLANLSLQDSPGFPSMRARLVESGTDQSRAEGTRLYDAYLARLTAILACGVEIPDECKEGYEGDPRAKAAAGALMPAPAPQAASAPSGEPSAGDQAAVTIEDVRIDENRHSAADASASQTQSGASGSSGSSTQSASGSSTPFDRQQTQIILAKLAAESSTDHSASTPSNRADALLQLQKEAVNVLMGVEGRSALPMLEQDGCVAFHGMMQILHRQLLEAKQDSKKREAEILLQPILAALSNLVQESRILRAHAKRCIFLDLSVAPPLPSGVKKTDSSNYGMAPAGAVSERIVDPDPRCLKSLLLPLVISLNFNLKTSVSEFLYRLCDEDSAEYIRLLGFGNAVGLLAEKGLPGFGMLKQQAISIDDVIKSGKKL